MIDANHVAPMVINSQMVPEAGGDSGHPVYADQVLTRSALRGLPDPEPLIADVLDQGTCGLLDGHRGSLKTFIALDWGLCVGTGRPWQKRATVQRRGLYVAAEGAFGLKGRVAAWELGWQRQIDDGTLDILPRPVNLLDPREVNSLGALISWGGYSFVILDTVARCMVGGDENSAKDSGVVVDRLYWLLDVMKGRGLRSS